jgi:hypothetical protein
MKPATLERLDDLAVVARRLQDALDAERPDALLAAAALCRLAGDVAEMVHRLEGHAAALRGHGPQRQGEK